MFANRFHPGRFGATHRNGEAKNRPEALRRRDLEAKLNALRKEDIRFRKGETVWLDHDRPDDVIAFSREYGGKKLWVLANTARSGVSVTLNGRIPADAERTIVSGAESEDGTAWKFAPRGFVLVREPM